MHDTPYMLVRMMRPDAVLAAVDTGGTFTDLVLWDGGTLSVHKVSSTPADPAEAVVAGLAGILAGRRLERATQLVHGSTVATNALLEGCGARVALVTNRGLEDVLELARQTRPSLYALAGEPRRLPVPMERRVGISGRLAASGEELAPLDADELEALEDRLSAMEAESVAVVLLHSYASDGHERAVAAVLRRSGLHCSVSSELLREYREYERTATTVVNAYVAPRMDAYLGNLEERSPAARIRIMGSSGGALSVARARHSPAHTILSGPAGGVAGALHVAQRHGMHDIMTFDMGGTSTDVSLCPGEALYTREFTVAGLPVALQVLDIHTVGAGGGSIARVDTGGALRVGPASAGAQPGPICYGRGGAAVTVTDANVALGRLRGGSDALHIDRALIDAPLAALAQQLGCSSGDAAEGIVAVVNAAMEGALRVISVERGYDAAAFTLVPFGGAAGLHAVALAERLEIPRLLLPPAPGVLSAYGMLVAPLRKDASRTVLLREPTAEELEPLFRELEDETVAAVAAEGIAAGDVLVQRTVAARYLGQSHELSVPAATWRDAFAAAHERRFGYALPDAAVEAVTLRVEAAGPALDLPVPQLTRADAPPVASGNAPVRFEGDVVTAAIFARPALQAGHAIRGPAIVEESTATFWLPPDWRADVLDDGCLLIERTDSGSGS
jgi:N-methylhydantoinase A